jgi:cell wall-associated NlpC family hydrolase
VTQRTRNTYWTVACLYGTFEHVRLFRVLAPRSVPAPRSVLGAVSLLAGAGLAAGLLLATGSPAARPVHASSHTAAVGRVPAGPRNPVAPLGQLHQASLLVVAPHTLPARLVAQVNRQRGVAGSEPVEAARMAINGVNTAVLGVDPSTFRGYTPAATAQSDAFWQGVADAGVAVSRSADGLGKLPLGSTLTVSGRQQEQLPLTGLGSLGIVGVGAVVSSTVASSLGMPTANALIVSIDGSDLTSVMKRINALLPPGAAAAPLISWVTSAPGSGVRATGGAMSPVQVNVMLRAALSRQGMPYVWGAAGPRAFDCSGLVQWSFAQAGISVPRVADDQALVGPAVAASRLAPGDLLFYRTEPAKPGYISHVAIYLGNGWMIQAPQTGMNVEVVPVDLGTAFAGAVQVSPTLAGSLAEMLP